MYFKYLVWVGCNFSRRYFQVKVVADIYRGFYALHHGLDKHRSGSIYEKTNNFGETRPISSTSNLVVFSFIQGHVGNVFEGV